MGAARPGDLVTAPFEHEVTARVLVRKATAAFHVGEQIAVDDFNHDRWTGKVLLRFVTPYGHFDRTVKASSAVFNGQTERAFEEMERDLLGHLRRHGVLLERVDWALIEGPE